MKHSDPWITAIHEAGHVLGCRLGGYPATVATIEPSGNYLGHVSSTRLKGWKEAIIESLLGHAAELEFGYNSEGHETDYNRAERELKELLRIEKSQAWSTRTGVKPTFGSTIFTHWQVPSGGDRDAKGNFISYRKGWRKAVRLSKSEWKSEFDKYVRKARRLAKKHRTYIENVARLLIQKRTLTDAEIPQLEKGN